MKRPAFQFSIAIGALYLLVEITSSSSAIAIRESRSIAREGKNGVVVSDDRLASEWGSKILEQGGNAIDAAIATAFGLAVSRPNSGSLGGGGFMVYCPAPFQKKNEKGETISTPSKCDFLDYREMAPIKSSQNMFIKDGTLDSKLSQKSKLSIGIPGVVAGLDFAHKKWGNLPWKKLLSQPIEMAAKGVPMPSYAYARAIERWPDLNLYARESLGRSCLLKNTARSKIETKEPCPPSSNWKQPELERALKDISNKGRDGFYKGRIAKAIVALMNENAANDTSGIISLDDMKNYSPRLREPLIANIGGYELVTAPPPSAGGVLLIQMLKMFERGKKDFLSSAEVNGEATSKVTGNAPENPFHSFKHIQLLAQVMQIAYADRAAHFGDPDQVGIPTKTLISDDYIFERYKAISLGKNIEVKGGEIQFESSPISPHDSNETSSSATEVKDHQTTHFVVIDKDGASVSVTTTINEDFGSGFVAKDTGIFLNNEMDDFAGDPGKPNLFGLIQSAKNAIAPGKRPVSSMTPTILRNPDGTTAIAIGAAGGPRITTAVFQAIASHLFYNIPLMDAVALGRVHHQWKPEELRFEKYAFTPETLGQFRSIGYKTAEVTHLAVVHAAERMPMTPNLANVNPSVATVKEAAGASSNFRFLGIPDSRGEGQAAFPNIKP